MSITKFAILAFAIGIDAIAAELETKVHDGREVEEGIYSDLWRFTVEPQDEQLVLATRLIKMDEDNASSGLPAFEKVEVIRYVSKGQYSEEVSYLYYFHKDRKLGDRRVTFEKWVLSGFGQTINLDPIFSATAATHKVSGRSSTVGSGSEVQKQCVSRRFRFENRTTRLTVKFSLETINLDEAKLMAKKAGVELPARKEDSWALTLPPKHKPAKTSGRVESLEAK